MLRLMFAAGFAAMMFGTAGAAEEIRLKHTAYHDVEISNGASYRLQVALPENYDPERAAGYPTLYVLDGDYTFGLARDTVRTFQLRPNFPDLIIVAIGYDSKDATEWASRRAFDFTPTSVQGADIRTTERLGVESFSGGGAQFADIVRNEIISRIEHAYNTSGDRALYGLSFGGLFASYVLFNETDLFSRYIIGSPSLWWDEGVTFSFEESFATAHDDLNTRVFISVGGDEPKELMVDPVRKMADTLQARGYENLTLTFHRFPDEGHLTVVPAALSRGLTTIYADLIDELESRRAR